MVVIDFPLLDTREEHNGITGQFIADLVLQILSYVAQIERENIHQRQAEGIKAAKEKGIKFGRPQRQPPHEFEQVYQKWGKGVIGKREAVKQLNASHSVFNSWAERYCAKNAQNVLKK